jgi:DNA-binding NarL/FixJ family response regulator
MRPPVRVLVVDDDPLVRSALVMVFGGAPDVAVVGEAGDGSEVPAALAAHSPDVVLMDVRMPRVDGLRATEAIVAARTGGEPQRPAVLVLTTFDTDELVLGALRAGAAGFLLKDTPPAQIVDAVRAVARGEVSVSPSALRHLVDAVARQPSRPDAATARAVAAQALLARLTDREREVAVAVGGGLSNAEVAARLHLSVATVKSHVTRILQALEVVNRVQVALVVHDAGAGHEPGARA